jgi:hypothetical protein
LLHNQNGEIGSLTQRLDELYMQILKVALNDISAELQDMVKLVLGSIVLLRDPLRFESREFAQFGAWVSQASPSPPPFRT